MARLTSTCRSVVDSRSVIRPRASETRPISSPVGGGSQTSNRPRPMSSAAAAMAVSRRMSRRTLTNRNRKTSASATVMMPRYWRRSAMNGAANSAKSTPTATTSPLRGARAPATMRSSTFSVFSSSPVTTSLAAAPALHSRTSRSAASSAAESAVQPASKSRAPSSCSTAVSPSRPRIPAEGTPAKKWLDGMRASARYGRPAASANATETLTSPATQPPASSGSTPSTAASKRGTAPSSTRTSR
jgi:hypothetical protein